MSIDFTIFYHCYVSWDTAFKCLTDLEKYCDKMLSKDEDKIKTDIAMNFRNAEDYVPLSI
jgi:hypothetical protein